MGKNAYIPDANTGYPALIVPSASSSDLTNAAGLFDAMNTVDSANDNKTHSYVTVSR